MNQGERNCSVGSLESPHTEQPNRVYTDHTYYRMSYIKDFSILSMNWLYPLILLALFYIVFRKRLEWEFPMILVRSKRFTQDLYDFGTRHQWFLRGFFTIGVVLGLLLMAYSFIYLAEGVIRLGEEEIPRLSIILPGQEFAGIEFPIVYWLIAISVAFIVHEGGHGIASSAEKIQPKNVALAMLLGVIPGAGVELDMEKIQQLSSLGRLRIMSAGTFMNVLFALFLIMARIPLVSLGENYVTLEGIMVTEVEPGSPGENMLKTGLIITGINDLKLSSSEDLQKIKEHIKPDSFVYIETNKGLYVVKTDEQGKIGFTGVPKMEYSNEPLPQLLLWVLEALGWTVLVCLGMGAANMMPLWPFDGGYLVKEVLDKIKISKALVPVYTITLILVLINLFSQQIKVLIMQLKSF